MINWEIFKRDLVNTMENRTDVGVELVKFCAIRFCGKEYGFTKFHVKEVSGICKLDLMDGDERVAVLNLSDNYKYDRLITVESIELDNTTPNKSEYFCVETEEEESALYRIDVSVSVIKSLRVSISVMQREVEERLKRIQKECQALQHIKRKFSCDYKKITILNKASDTRYETFVSRELFNELKGRDDLIISDVKHFDILGIGVDASNGKVPSL